MRSVAKRQRLGNTPSTVNLAQEGLIPLTLVPQLVPRVEGIDPPTLQTVRNWAADGVRGKRLATWRLGGRILTSRAALAEFLAVS